MQDATKGSDSVPYSPRAAERPYAEAAPAYRKKGWLNPLPVGLVQISKDEWRWEPGRKSSVPRGYTGADGLAVDDEAMQGWRSHKFKGAANIGLRLDGVVGIDIDGAEGQGILYLYGEERGALPATFSSTSRGPGQPRRILFFRIPDGLDVHGAEWALAERHGTPGPEGRRLLPIDILHHGYRYAVVYPSVHPSGEQYRWYGPDGELCTIPEAGELPMLPDAWCELFRELVAEHHQRSPRAKAGERKPGAAGTPEDGPISLRTAEKMRETALANLLAAEYGTDRSDFNHALNVRALFLFRFAPEFWTEDEIQEALETALTQKFGAPDADDTATLRSARSAVGKAGYEPFQREPDVDDAAFDFDPDEAGGEEPMPPVVAKEDASGYTDAVLGGQLAEAMSGRFYYTTALGWLKWDSTRWAPVSDEVTHEVVRRWVLGRHRAAVTDFLERQAAGRAKDGDTLGNDPAVQGWSKTQSRARISAIAATARGHGLIFRDASIFDQQDYLLNTPSGVIDLRTGQVLEHDPARLITKVAGAAYVPGAESPALKSALDAVPADALGWLQLRLGEALSGRSGEQLTLLSGGGRNGKTLLMGSVFRAMGDYAAKVPNTLLLRSRQVGAATPERMTLRGIRLAYMEETPEDGYLDATVVKDLLDAEEIEGRYLYKDTVTWRPTHSLFLNTNHAPAMGDTGDGAWRRLTRLDFPFRYRKADEELEHDTDRRGDPGLKLALGGTAEGREALLAWLVAGAVRFFSKGSLEGEQEPDSVRAAVKQWRADSDDLLRFVAEEMVFEPDGFVSRTDMYEAFSAWLRRGGQKGLSAKKFAQRMAAHSILRKRVTSAQIDASDPNLTRPQNLLREGLVRPLGSRVRVFAGLAFVVDQGFELDI
jgi:putative DNA primase/helicase